MQSEVIVTKQFKVIFDEEEARRVRILLDALQPRDYEPALLRAKVDDVEEQNEIINEMDRLKEALQPAPAAHSGGGTRHL